MWKTTILAGAMAAAFAIPAFANSTLVSCVGYVISLTDELAIEGQARAGSQAAFENLVCERSQELDPTGYDEPTVVPVFVEELGISSRVVVFPVDTSE